MIKVNLLKDVSQQQRNQAGTKLNINIPSLNDSNQGPWLQRIIIFIAPIIFVYGYGWYIDLNVSQVIKSIQTQIKTVESQTESYKPQLDSIEKLNAEKNKITAQVEAIKDLSRQRYANVKVLDAIQNLIPEKAWLTKINIKEKTILLEGRTNNDDTISNFMQNLEESAYFKNVTLDNSKEVSEPQGTFKMFNIHFALENL